MTMIAKTITRGFRTCYFRNQPVHHFYGHLQAVLKDISPDGEMNDLFAKPEPTGPDRSEIEWSTNLSGSAVSFKDLDPAKKKEIAAKLADYIDRIRKYAESRQNKTGLEKDYAQYLKAVAMSPDPDQVFVIGNKPVLVHWGFFCDSENHPGQGIYAGWDEFIAQIQRKAEPAKTEPAPEPEKPQKAEPAPDQAAAAAAIFNESKLKKPDDKKEATNQTVKRKTVELVKKVEEPPEKKKEKIKKDPKEEQQGVLAPEKKKNKKVVSAEPGDYIWVKWLAIILAILILILLLLTLLPQRSPFSGTQPGAGQMGISGGAGGGMPAGQSGAQGMPSGGQQIPGICPHCGHQIENYQPQNSHGAQGANSAESSVSQEKEQKKEVEDKPQNHNEQEKIGQKSNKQETDQETR